MDNEALIAAKKGDISKLKERLDHPSVKINAQDENGRTLLHHAAYHGQHEVVECLLKYGADILITTDKNNTALHIAISKSDDAVVNTMLENVSRNKLRKLLDMKTKATGTSALHVAAKADNFMDVSFLLEHGANFEMTNDAGEKPIDLTNSDALRELFQLIDTSFTKAKDGVNQMADDLEKLNPQDFTSVANCRNNEGHTLIQVLLLNERYRLASDILWFRVNQPINRDHEPLQDPDRKKEVAVLAKGAREFREFWEKQKEAMTKFVKTIKNEESSNAIILTRHAVKLGALALEKGHEVLLAYRKFEGKQRSLTADPRMKTLEEAIEAVGFNPERLFVIVGEDDCYYQKLPIKWKENISSLVDLIDSTIEASIDFYLGHIYSMQHFNAVKNDDMDKIEQLIDKRVVNHGADRDGRTALYNAVEKGNEQMVKMLLDSGAGVNYLDALSPVYLATSKGYAKMVTMLLQKVHSMNVHKFVDCHEGPNKSTALHVAAEMSRLDIVKTLLKFGATYCIFDAESRTPLDVSSNEEVSNFLKLVDECFQDAKKTNAELVPKLEAMPTDDFLAITSARNRQGQAILDVLTKAKANKMFDSVARMIDMTKFKVL